MLQLRADDPAVGVHAEEPTPAVTFASLRWLIGVLPWALLVILLGLLDAGCAPAETPGDSEPTPFPDFGDDDDSGVSDDDDGGIGGPYPAILRPDFDETFVSRLAAQWVEFSEEGVIATLSLTAPDGEGVAGRSMRVGETRYLFLPDTPLDGDATYGMAVQWGEDSALDWTFTTRPAREPVGNIDGLTLAWDLNGAAAASPPGAEAFIGALPLGVLTQVAGEQVVAGMAAAESDPITQDPCIATFAPTENGPARWDDPLLATPGTLLRLTVDLSVVGFGIQVLPLRDVQLAAELVADEDGILSIAEGSFVAWVDAREVAVAGVCDTLGSVAIGCSPCPGDGEEQCLVIALEDIAGQALDLDIEPRTATDVKTDPACQPAEPQG